jgi:uncharacterized protein DUF429
VVVVSLGIDLAAQAELTATCRVRWSAIGARIEAVEHEVDDSRLTTELVGGADKTGVDVPLGWPDDFVRSVALHRAGRPFGHTPTPRLVHRATDRFVRERFRQVPLSVSTDKIAYPAMRAARILGALPGQAVDRSGAGAIVEVYPAVALRIWGLPYRQYKRAAGAGVLTEMIRELRRRCEWMSATDDVWGRVAQSDHAFDALVCALVARAHFAGLCHPVPAELQDVARREGWIAAPVEGSLDRLPREPVAGA